MVTALLTVSAATVRIASPYVSQLRRKSAAPAERS
jgi:hypothetical protein